MATVLTVEEKKTLQKAKKRGIKKKPPKTGIIYQKNKHCRTRSTKLNFLKNF